MICCCSFFVVGICIASNFVMVSSGIIAWPAIHQVPKNLTSLEGPWHLFEGTSIPSSLYSMCPVLQTLLHFLLRPPPTHHQSIPSWIFICWRSLVNALWAIVGGWLCSWGRQLNVYCVPSQVNANLGLSFSGIGTIKKCPLYVTLPSTYVQRLAVKQWGLQCLGQLQSRVLCLC